MGQGVCVEESREGTAPARGLHCCPAAGAPSPLRTAGRVQPTVPHTAGHRAAAACL